MFPLQAHISEKFKGKIWKIEIDELNGLLFLEIRDENERKVAFGSVNLKTGAFNFKELVGFEPWLIGMEAAFNNVLLLHLYQSAASPQHKGIMAVNGLTGETLWSNYNYCFDHITTRGPIGYDTRIEPRKLFLFDIQTGEIISKIDKSDNTLNNKNIEYPTAIIPNFLPDYLFPKNTITKSVQYHTFNNYIIVSLHTFENEVLKHLIYVFANNTIIYQDLLNDNIKKMQPESFFLFESFLIYVKNNVELKVLSLLKL